MSDIMLAPIVRTLALRCRRDAAFAAFTEHIGKWWPSGFTASGDKLADVVIEGKEGGRVYEVSKDGDEYGWGSVTAWDPGRRVVQSWTLALGGGRTTEVELLFSGDGDTCEVRFEHRGWSADQAADRSKFDAAGGWNVVLGAYRVYTEKL